MASNPNSRSGVQTAVDLARLAKAIYNIVRAAIAAGLHGAAVAAAKEALPFLVKVAAWVLFFFVFFPILVFVSLPNIFFGFNTADADSVIQMTDQAFAIGGAYMSLDEFERTQVDAIVTSMAAEYEEQGTEIDRIEVENHMDEEDLLWLIAINSVAHDQDLNTMSAESVREFCSAQLSTSSSLSTVDSGEDGTVTTLRVTVEGIDPERLMNDLGFDEDAKTWAGALYETIFESDAIETYGDYFAAYEPDYSGDSGWSGQIEYVARMRAYAEAEENEKCREMIEDNIAEVDWLGASSAITRRFFLVFQYEPQMKAKRNTVRAIAQRLSEEADTARRYLDVCGLEVLEPRYADNTVLELLYELINKKTSRRVKLPEGVFDMTTAVHGLYETGGNQ